MLFPLNGGSFAATSRHSRFWLASGGPHGQACVLHGGDQRAILVVTLLFEAEAAWTDLMRGLIYLRDSSTFTVPRGLKDLVDQYGFGGEWHWEILVTASVITTVPIIILFFFGQKHFVSGVATTGLKG